MALENPPCCGFSPANSSRIPVPFPCAATRASATCRSRLLFPAARPPLESSTSQAASLPANQAGNLDGLRLYLKARRHESFRQVRGAFSSSGFQTEMSGMERFLETWYKSPPRNWADSSIGDLAWLLLERHGRKVTRQCRSLVADTPDEDFHRLRISIKKLRYLLEFFEALYPERERIPLYGVLVDLLTSLGTFQDSSTQIDQLDRAALDLAWPFRRDQQFAMGMLTGIYLEQHRSMKRRLHRQVRQFDRGLIKALMQSRTSISLGGKQP